ncbi:MAG: hypothetical protein EXS64_11015 [Candidatus Latescibacteria bacterium]|nr:hypothetical protein [Candidatus Latescibacterota bacterium]
MDAQKNLLDHLQVLVRWRRMILTSVLSISVLTAVLSLLIAERFRAQATIFPPEEEQSDFGLAALLSKSPVNLGKIGGQGLSAQDFVPIAKSRSVAEAVMDSFHLDRLWQSRNREQALKTFGQRLTVQLSREEFLSVSFEAESPQLAADVTNAVIEEMDRAYRRSKSDRASRLRQHLEKELTRAQGDVEKVERAYNAFQQEHLAVNLEEQTKAAIEGASHLIDQIAELKIKIGAGREFMTDSNEKMVGLEAELRETQRLLDRMVGSPDGPVKDGEGPQVYIPFNRVPDLGMDLLRRTRDLKIQEAVYGFLRQKYEEAKYEEAKATPAIQVLDRAVPPLFRSRPQRTLMVAGAGAASLLISAFLAFLFEAFREMRPEDREKLSGLWRGSKR